jgi:hypothetical protein
MKEDKEPLGIELFFDDENDLDELMESKEFHDILFNEVVRALKVAFENKENKATILFLTNLRYALVVSKDNFSNLIDSVVSYFEKLEDYEKCKELIELKKEL